MVTTADLIKRTPSTGVKTTSRFRGYASFGNGESSVLLELADSFTARQRGLMGRKSLPECCGMLFTGLTGGSFWMKGCLIDLDVVFLDDGKVSLVYTMKADGGEKMYRYGSETAAIELPAGFCRRHGISKGTKVEVRTWR